MKIKKIFKTIFSRKKTVRTESGVGVPKEWAKPSSKRTLPKLDSKIHVPLLRPIKRLLAAILLAVNFIISQATLTSHPDTQPLFWLFILNAFIILDYLWKTRRA